jgi:signal peptidase
MIKMSMDTILNSKKSRIKKIAKVIGNTLFAFLLLLIGVCLFFIIQSKAFNKVPTLGGYYLYEVMSGSMEPVIRTGSIIFEKPVNPEQLTVNDVITFKGADNKLVTHRFVNINHEGSLFFTTKGDANNANDQTAVPYQKVVGKANFSIPYAGYVINFAQSKYGILLVIIVPGFVLLILEIRKLIKYVILLDREKEKKKSHESEMKILEGVNTKNNSVD